jgi:hypothetical protein
MGTLDLEELVWDRRTVLREDQKKRRVDSSMRAL